MRKVLVTGSEGKIGQYICQRLASEFDVIRIDIALGQDLTDPNVVKTLFDSDGPIYAIINCHAHNPVPTANQVKTEPTDLSLDELRSYVEVNLISLFEVCKQYIRSSPGGRIINISSLYGLRSPKHHIYDNYVKPLGYVLTKTAVISLSKYLASYYAPDFLVNTVVFGGVANNRHDDSFRINYETQTPMGRMMEVKEVYAVFKFLLDEANTYTTGTEIVVDGGWSSW